MTSNDPKTTPRGYRPALGLAALAVGMMTALGCGGGGPPVGEVTGTVTVDGEPLAAGGISFVPVDGQAPSAGGDIKDGKYSVKAPIGAAKVAITSPKEVGKKKQYDTPTSPEVPVYKESIPEKYNTKTELKTDIKAGPNQADFPLVTKK